MEKERKEKEIAQLHAYSTVHDGGKSNIFSRIGTIVALARVI